MKIMYFRGLFTDTNVQLGNFRLPSDNPPNQQPWVTQQVSVPVRDMPSPESMPPPIIRRTAED